MKPHLQIQNPKSKIQNFKGVALVAVLAVLVVLTILAASFSVMMNLELKQSNEQRNSYLLDTLTEAGFEHAKTLLWTDSESAKMRNSVKTVAIKFQSTKNKGDKIFSKWFYLKNETGKTVGRYRIKIEDEAAKVNINRARLPKNSKGYGWDTGEINLSKALGVPDKIAKKILQYRYGPNLLPGGRGDDDYNNVVLMADGIDNNANGIIDEENEGYNDPGEYKADNLKGDDRKFSTVNETVSILMDTKKPLPYAVRAAMREKIPRRATIYSIDEPGSPTLRNDMLTDINCMTARDCRRMITKANERKTFIPGGQKRAQLAANIVDYRDENHVLSTLGSTYGVEAVCFNEVMANDESTTIDPVYAKLPFWNDPDLWRDNFGMVDGERCIYSPNVFYDCIADSPSQLSKRFQVIDPREAWHIKKKEGEPPDPNQGYIKNIRNNTTTIKWPKAIGKDGNKIDGTLYMEGKSNKRPVDILPGNEPYLSWPSKPNPPIFYGKSSYNDICKRTLDKLEKVGMGGKFKPKFKNNYFKNSLVMIYRWQKTSDDKNNISLGCFKILSSDDDSITFENENYFNQNSIYNFKNVLGHESLGMSEDDHDLSISINAWTSSRSVAWVPEANQTYVIRSRQPIAGRYFKIIIGRPPLAPQNAETGLSGYPDELGVSGRIGGPFSEDKKYKRRMWEYNDGDPVRTKQNGWIDILVTSASRGIDREQKKGQKINYIRMVAPEVSEMYNASATPVSLANWRVICNTGSKATEIGLIHDTSYYDRKLKQSVTTDNPVVEPGGHFYLVNDTKLFDYWYGSGNGEWGSSPKEEIPVFQMDADNWGVAYKVKKAEVKGNGIYLTPANFDFDPRKVFGNETIKFLDPDRANDPKSWNNVFAYVSDQGDPKPSKDEFFTWSFGETKYLKGADLMILGLPSDGGIVSLTLKNEYEQICARTLDYGQVKNFALGKSSEKIDPTKNTWKKRNKHTIAGRNRDALNRSMRTRRGETFFIKNGPYGSIGEMRHVTTGNDFERLGGKKGDISKGLNSLGALADVLSCSHIRLESASGNVARKGWKEAKDEVENSSLTVIKAKNGGWQADKWKGQTVRFLTGPLRGEKFLIIGNTKNSITLSEKGAAYKPYSAPNRKLCQPNKGDTFSIGPGHASAFCYTRIGGDVGEWEWKNAVPNVGRADSMAKFNLYIYGLNDAIDTTEFFEENNNSSLDVDVWNYKTQTFDPLCNKKKYGKQDSFLAGKISSDNISDSGDFKIRLTAHEVAERNLEADSDEARVDTGGRQTGIAWFNYAAISPVPVPARVNINTAPARLLASLPGITSKLAKNIANGTGSDKDKNLKPYKRLGDVMRVQGMTPEIFERCANILTVDSSYFTVEVEAQSLKGGMPDAEEFAVDLDRVTGTRSKRFVLKIDETEDKSSTFKMLEKYSL